MASPDLRTFFDRSLELLAREAPGAYGRMCRAIQGLDLCVIDGDRRFAVRSHANRVLSDTVRGDEPVVASIDRPTILALVDGALTLEQAVREDRLFVRASPSRVAAAFDALLIYVRGAIRCPSFPTLLSDLRTATLPDEHQP